MKPRSSKKSPQVQLKEVADISYSSAAGEEAMVRTQIYLTRAEHEYLLGESARRGEPMAAIIRGLVDEKMRIPEDAWINNPMLEPTVDDPDWEDHEDGSINHDHYVYGCPKKYEKINGEWVLLPPLDE